MHEELWNAMGELKTALRKQAARLGDLAGRMQAVEERTPGTVELLCDLAPNVAERERLLRVKLALLNTGLTLCRGEIERWQQFEGALQAKALPPLQARQRELEESIAWTQYELERWTQTRKEVRTYETSCPEQPVALAAAAA